MLGARKSDLWIKAAIFLSSVCASRTGGMRGMYGAMTKVEKITIALTPEMAEFVRNAVEAGQYASTSEAIREAVREWKERRELLGYTVDELRDLLQEGTISLPNLGSLVANVEAEVRCRFDQHKHMDRNSA